MAPNDDDAGPEPKKPEFSWQAAGQLLATVSVVLSLLFVGLEIRQNTAVARMTASQAFTQQLIDINQIVVTELYAPLNTRINAGELRDRFTAEEQLRIDVTLISILRIWESLYRAVQVGVTDPEMIDGLRDGPGPFRNQYFRESWPFYRGTFTDDFAAFVEDALDLR